MSASLGEAVLHLKGDGSQLEKDTSNAKTKVTEILGKMGAGMAVAAKGVSIAGGAIAALGAGIFAMTAKGAANADQILELSDKYSVATDQIQKMKYAAELVDVPLETMLGSFTRLTMSMGEAKDPTSEQAKLFKELGVDAIDPLTGQLRSANDVWMDTIGALEGVENSAERDALSLKLFGRSAMELNPLIAAGTDVLKELGDEAVASGYVMSESQLEALGKVDDAMQKMKNGAQGVLNQLASIFAPGIAAMVDTVGGYLGKLGAIMGDDTLSNSEKIVKATDLVKTIAKDISTNLPGLAQSGIGILTAIIQGIVDSLPTLIPAVVTVLMSLVQFIIQMAPILLQGAMQILLGLAMGIAQALPTLIPAVVQMLLMMVQFLIENLPMIIDAGLQIVMGLIMGLIEAIPMLIEAIPTLIVSIVDALMQALPMIIVAAIQIIIALISGLITSIPLLIEAIPQIITGIIDAFKNGLSNFKGIGADIMESFNTGLKSKFEAIWKGVKDFAEGIIKKIKDALDLHSPSPLAIGIGVQWMDSLGMGIENRINAVGDLAARAGQRIAMGTMGGFAMAGSGSNSENYQFYAPVYIQDGKNIGASLKARRY